jgi:hypothetical protein
MTLSQKRQALLKQKGDEYIATMEAPGRGINYNRIETDRLLILEAINDWSGRVLVEGGDIKLTYGCDDPSCASEYELNELARRMHSSPTVLYPVSGFSLSDEEDLRFGYRVSSYRMMSHTSESRSDAIRIVEAQRIRDVEAAIQLWAFCATEDCMVYLYHYMDSHGLFLEEGERSAVRRIITSSLQEHFSIGQIWNAMWRSVKDAAALSTRQYYNNAKAAKTIPKKIDKVLMSAASDPNFEAYERPAATPLGAVLTLFYYRFGINDATTGAQVRAKLTADAALATPEEPDDEEFDEGRGLVRGTMFFLHQFTEFDRLVLSCFNGLRIERQEPEWDEKHVIGRLDYSLDNVYAFNGQIFADKLFALMRVAPPSSEDIARHAAAAKEQNARIGGFADESGWSWALSEALEKGGMSSEDAGRVGLVIRYPATPDEVARIVRYIPVLAGLSAIRVDFAHVYSDFIEKSDRLCVGDFTFAIPEEHLEPDGCDRDIVIDVAARNFNHLAVLITTSILRSISCENDEQKAQLLTLVAKNLLEQVKPPLTDNEARGQMGSDALPVQ